MNTTQKVEPSGPNDVVVVSVYENGAKHLWYWCEVCDTHHVLPIKGTPKAPVSGYEEAPQWEWNGDKVQPSTVPSVLSKGYAAQKNGGVCHHYVTKGKIMYLGDTTHELAGKIIPLKRPPISRE
jgi:hypothetical protein